MASPSLPRSIFGTASLLERKNALPLVDVGEGSDAEVTVEEPGLVDGPDINIEMEEDGSVVVPEEMLYYMGGVSRLDAQSR